jgi:2-amino-4-hydroxy-6-hydroxymethyldihydropteridine diphosphokinase
LNRDPVLIILGSNIEPEHYLPRAVQLIAEAADLRGVSRVYESAPVNAAGVIAAGQGQFLNAAVLIETVIPPADLKYTVLRTFETTLGRIRTGDKFAARTIDLDLALYGNLVLDDPRLPDPDILTRAYIALPLADLAPDFRHPITGQTLAEIAARFANAPGITVRDDVSLTF